MLKNDTLFFAGFIPYLIHEMWNTTMFSLYIHGTREILFTLLCLGLMFLKIMLYDHFTVKQLVYSVFLLIVGALTFWGTGNIDFFSIMVIIIASKDVNFDKLISIWLVVVVTIMLMAFVASQLGIIANLQYESSDFFTGKIVKRNSFGIIYPTDCAAHIFFCTLTLFYLRRNHLKWFVFIVGIITSIFVYYYCRAKIDALSIMLLVLLFFLALVFKENVLWKKIWKKVGLLITPMLCIIMIFLTYVYKQNGVLERVNRFISGRLALGKSGLDEYGLTFFGQKIRLIGFGRSTDTFHINYNFLDVSYINILVVCGIVFLTAFILVYTMIGYVHRKNTFLLCALSLVALNCAIAHHMTAIEYNVFTLALFATATNKENEN